MLLLQLGLDSTSIFFINKDQKTIEKEMDEVFQALPKEIQSSISNVVGEMYRVTDSTFRMRVNPLNLFCSLITEIGSTEEETKH